MVLVTWRNRFSLRRSSQGLVDVELGAEVVEDVIGRSVETTSGGEGEMGTNEEIGEVLGVDFAGDWGVC